MLCPSLHDFIHTGAGFVDYAHKFEHALKHFVTAQTIATFKELLFAEQECSCVRKFQSCGAFGDVYTEFFTEVCVDDGIGQGFSNCNVSRGLINACQFFRKLERALQAAC